MVFFTLSELLDLVIMVFGLGYIFMGIVQRPRSAEDLLLARGFDWDGFKLAVLITAPAIVLHEMAHKFVALFFGLVAVFHASYFGLVLGIFLRVMSSPFIIFVPGYVAIQGASPLQSALTAFAGPGMNLALFLVGWIMLTYTKRLTFKQKFFWLATKKINLFLFFFNMIPLPPFDGYSVVHGLFSAFF